MAGEDQAVALYGLAKKQLESMHQREAELQKATAALQATVAELKGLPFTLGKQTSQYIGMGVREAMEQDFRPPIKEALQPPISELRGALGNAREAIQEVSRYAKYQTWGWLFSIFVIGFVAGVLVSQLSLASKIDGLREQIAAQQQAAPAAPVQEAKPVPGGTTKGRHGHPAAPGTAP